MEITRLALVAEPICRFVTPKGQLQPWTDIVTHAAVTA